MDNMKYVANPVVVDAYEIEHVSTEDTGEINIQILEGPDRKRMVLPAEVTARYIPVAGDYLVVQSDGYVYVNPKEVFERKYRKSV